MGFFRVEFGGRWGVLASRNKVTAIEHERNENPHGYALNIRPATGEDIGDLRESGGEIEQDEENPIRKPTVPEVVPLAQAVHERNFVGCCLHIVLDDYNVENHHIEFCRLEAEKEGHADCLLLCKLLMMMTKTQRKKLAKVDMGRHG